MLVTTHTIVRNEERFIKYAIASVIDHVDQMLVYDTGSTDKTVDIIRSFSSPKIIFEQKGVVDRSQLAALRQEQLDRTKSDWLYNLDGDEIYPESTIKEVIKIMKTTPKETLGIVIPFYNWVGDIYHVQSESAGRYRFGNHQGHLNLRGIRILPGLSVTGKYPNEAYVLNGVPVQEYRDKITFADNKFFHAGNLRRSSLDGGVMERKEVLDMGVPLKDQLPEVMTSLPPNLTRHRSTAFVVKSSIKQAIKKLLLKS